RLAGQLGVVAEQFLGPPQVEPDPVGQLAGRLAGEGEPEHLVGTHVAVDDQPDHPQRHQLGLAGAGAGHHEQRFVVGRADDAQLLRAEVVGDAQPVSQLFGGEPGPDHSSVTCRPWPDSGQARRTVQYGQDSLMTAWNVDAAIAVAALTTSCRAQVGSSLSDSGGCTRTAVLAWLVPTATISAPPDAVPSAKAPASTATW